MEEGGSAVGIIFGLAIIAILISIPIYIFKKNNKRKLYNSTSDSKCEICGKLPAVILMQFILKGKIIFYEYYEIKKSLCKKHGMEVYKQCQKETALKGWWTPYNLLRTPLVLLSNRSFYKQFTVAFKKRESI